MKNLPTTLPVNPARIQPDRIYHHQGLQVRFHLAWVADYDLPYTSRTDTDRDLKTLADRVRQHQTGTIHRAWSQGDDPPWHGPSWLKRGGDGFDHLNEEKGGPDPGSLPAYGYDHEEEG